MSTAVNEIHDRLATISLSALMLTTRGQFWRLYPLEQTEILIRLDRIAADLRDLERSHSATPPAPVVFGDQESEDQG
jgi:hypothetical protein